MKLHGVIPIVPTPFTADESIDFEAHARLVEFSVRGGAGGVGLPAYGSEFYKLTEQERFDLIASAVKAARGRVPVVAQCNHVSARIASEMARRAEGLGASCISIELSHMFPFGFEQYMAFAERVANSVKISLLVQDWNPTGATVGAEWVAELNRRCPNFRYIKLEEPSMGAKVRAIREATNDAVSVFEGWGGLYTLELVPAGIKGLMPGVALVDVFADVFKLSTAGRMTEAYDRFAPIVPFLVFCLQNMEHFHHVEKTLLTRRGLLEAPHFRAMSVRLDADSQAYLDLLVSRLDSFLLPRA